MKKKILALLILVLVLIMIPAPVSSSNRNNPDLIITDIKVKRHLVKADEIVYLIKNNGESVFTEWSCHVVVEKLFLGTIAIRTVMEYNHLNEDAIISGETVEMNLFWEKYIFVPGVYMIHVYPNSQTGEPYYERGRSEKFLGVGFIFTNWFQCY